MGYFVTLDGLRTCFCRNAVFPRLLRVLGLLAGRAPIRKRRTEFGAKPAALEIGVFTTTRIPSRHAGEHHSPGSPFRVQRTGPRSFPQRGCAPAKDLGLFFGELHWKHPFSVLVRLCHAGFSQIAAITAQQPWGSERLKSADRLAAQGEFPESVPAASEFCPR